VRSLTFDLGVIATVELDVVKRLRPTKYPALDENLRRLNDRSVASTGLAYREALPLRLARTIRHA
jgi:hypothetical protein